MTRAVCWLMAMLATAGSIIGADRNAVCSVVLAIVALSWLHAAVGVSALNDDIDRRIP